MSYHSDPDTTDILCPTAPELDNYKLLTHTPTYTLTHIHTYTHTRTHTLSKALYHIPPWRTSLIIHPTMTFSVRVCLAADIPSTKIKHCNIWASTQAVLTYKERTVWLVMQRSIDVSSVYFTLCTLHLALWTSQVTRHHYTFKQTQIKI